MLLAILFLTILTTVQCSPMKNSDLVQSAEQYPFVVRLLATSKDIYKGEIVPSKNLCTGVLVTLDFVVTAAHCLIDHVIKPHVIVKAGVVNLVEEISQTALMLDYKKHRFYDDGDEKSDEAYSKNDIAVIWLDKQLTPSPKVRPANMNCNPNEFAGLHGVAVGWGGTNHEAFPKTLQKGTFQVISNKKCEELIKTALYKQFCVILGEKKSYPAQGDSGGPFVIQNMVVGLSSWMSNQGRRIPIYIRIDPYIDWIRKNYKNGPPNTKKKFFGNKNVLEHCEQSRPSRSRSSSSSSSSSSDRSRSPKSEK